MSEFDCGFAEIQERAGHAHLRVSLFSGASSPSAVLFAAYRRTDPLVVSLDIRTPEGVTVFRRTVLRADFELGLGGPVAHAGTRLRPTDGGMIEIAFTDEGASVALRVPEAAARRFLVLSRQIVPVEQEGSVLGELAAELSLDRG